MKYIFKALYLTFFIMLNTQHIMAQQESCSPATSAQIRPLLDQAKTKIYIVDFDVAIELLNNAEQILPCLEDVINPDLLSSLYLYRGVAALQQGDESGSVAAFRQALAFYPDIQWDEKFGKKAGELFTKVKSSFQNQVTGTVKIPNLKEGVTLYLNGSQISKSETITLPSTSQFLQIKIANRVVKGMLFTVLARSEVYAPIPSIYLEQPKQAVEVVQTKKNIKTKEFFRKRAIMFFGGATLTGASGAGLAYYTKTIQDDLKNNYFSNREDSKKNSLIQKQVITAYSADAAFGASIILAGFGTWMYIKSINAPRANQNKTSLLLPWATTSSLGLSWYKEF